VPLKEEIVGQKKTNINHVLCN